MASEVKRHFKAFKASYGGGGTSKAVTAHGVGADDIAFAQVVTSTNACYVKAVCTANTVTLTFNTDPGASTVVNVFVVKGSFWKNG